MVTAGDGGVSPNPTCWQHRSNVSRNEAPAVTSEDGRFIGSGSHLCGALADRGGSRHAQTLEVEGASRSATDVRHDHQFKNRDIGEFNVIILDSSCVVLGGLKFHCGRTIFSEMIDRHRQTIARQILGYALVSGFLENERDAPRAFAAHRRSAGWFEFPP